MLRATIEHLTKQISHSLETVACVAPPCLTLHCPALPSIQLIGKLDQYFRLVALVFHTLISSSPPLPSSPSTYFPFASFHSSKIDHLVTSQVLGSGRSSDLQHAVENHFQLKGLSGSNSVPPSCASLGSSRSRGRPLQEETIKCYAPKPSQIEVRYNTHTRTKWKEYPATPCSHYARVCTTQRNNNNIFSWQASASRCRESRRERPLRSL